MHFHMWAAQFLFENSENYMLFASPALRDACIKNATEELRTCAEGQYILIKDVQERLCLHIACARHTPLHILTFAECSSMYDAFLLQKDIQQAIMRLENCAHRPGNEYTLEQKYASKLEKILSNYSLLCALKYKNDAHSRKTYKEVHFIAQRYYNFVLKLGYIDYACATIALCENYDECTMKISRSFWNKIFVFGPSFFPLSPHVFLQYFGATFENSLTDKVIPLQNTSSTAHTKMRIENARETNTFFLKKPEPTHTQHIVFANVAEELNWACSTALRLQKDGALPQEIALNISSIDDFIRAELISLSAKYDIEFNMQYMQDNTHNVTIHAFLQNMDACVNTFMHPNALKNLLLFPAIPWNNRAQNIELITLGMKHTCIDNADVARWKEVLSTSKNTPLKKYFFALYNALRAILKAKTYQSLQTTFYACARTFMHTQNTTMPFWGQTINHILEILNELAIQENFVQHNEENAQSAFKTRSPWSVLCSIALRRKTRCSKNENAILVCEFPASLGTYYKHHFFVNLSQESLKKAVSPPVLFHDFIDAQLFENTYHSYKIEMTAQYKTAMEWGGTHVYISTSREEYKGMRITPTEWDFIDYTTHMTKETAPALPALDDPWIREMRLWNIKSYSEKELSHVHVTKRQRQGMHAQQYTKRNNIRSMRYSPLLLSTKKIIQTHFEASTIPIGSIATLLADPVYFLLQHVFAVTPLFEDMSENLKMPVMLGSAFHAILARTFSQNTEPTLLIQETLQSLHAHAFVEMTLRTIFQSTEMHQYILRIREFITKTMHDLECTQIKSEETVERSLHEIFLWAKGVFSNLRVRGRSDALLCNDENHVRYIVDYKTKMTKPLSYFAQLWMYNMAHTDSKKDTEVHQNSHALFLLLKNFHKSKIQKPIDFRHAHQKEEPHIQQYEALLQHSLLSILCSDEIQSTQTQDAIYATQVALTKELFQDIAYACIARKHCYIYQNYISEAYYRPIETDERKR